MVGAKSFVFGLPCVIGRFFDLAMSPLLLMLDRKVIEVVAQEGEWRGERSLKKEEKRKERGKEERKLFSTFVIEVGTKAATYSGGGGWSTLYTQSLHRSFASCARPLSPFLPTPPSPPSLSVSLLSVYSCARRFFPL